jgi:hypothetical protein
MSDPNTKYCLVVTETGVQGQAYEKAEITQEVFANELLAYCRLQELFGDKIRELNTPLVYCEFDWSEKQARIFGENEVIVMAVVQSKGGKI